jgi:GNAT superfamily N-acetyltransferase
MTNQPKQKRGNNMNIEIRKLTIQLLEDWLYFFDKVAFCGNDKWAGCYCMCFHWNEELANKRKWGCSPEDGSFNRECAAEFIKRGKMKGYLAYDGGKVIGWCNANDKSAYDNVNITLPADETEEGKRVMSIACFCIAPDYRGKGVASKLLEAVCLDAAEEGYDFIETYPFEKDENMSYLGPVSMYKKQGFEAYKQFYECTIHRKYLKESVK